MAHGPLLVATKSQVAGVDKPSFVIATKTGFASENHKPEMQIHPPLRDHSILANFHLSEF